MDEEFWDDMIIPFQTVDKEFQWVNSVVVVRKFITSIGTLSMLGKSMEVLTEQLGSLNVQLEAEQRKLKVLRKEILSRHYKAITKSASSELQDAFIRNKAQEDGVLADLTILETEIERLTVQIARRKPRVAQYQFRIKTLNTSMEWAKQYVDFDKMVTKSEKFG